MAASRRSTRHATHNRQGGLAPIERTDLCGSFVDEICRRYGIVLDRPHTTLHLHERVDIDLELLRELEQEWLPAELFLNRLRQVRTTPDPLSRQGVQRPKDRIRAPRHMNRGNHGSTDPSSSGFVPLVNRIPSPTPQTREDDPQASQTRQSRPIAPQTQGTILSQPQPQPASAPTLRPDNNRNNRVCP